MLNRQEDFEALKLNKIKEREKIITFFTYLIHPFDNRLTTLLDAIFKGK